MKKLAFPLHSQNLLRIDEYDMHKFSNPSCIIRNIIISGNCRIQIYKFYTALVPKFCQVTKVKIFIFLVLQPDKVLVYVFWANLLILYTPVYFVYKVGYNISKLYSVLAKL